MTDAAFRPATGLAVGPAGGLSYGLLGAPLAFVALPLYVQLPNHYATQFGVPLATLGAVLLGARLLDAVADPWIGRYTDGLFNRSSAAVLRLCTVAALLLALGFAALFFPPRLGAHALVAWCAALLVTTYLGYSALSIAHQSWGARLGGDAAQQARVVGWREGCGLLGVVVASVLPPLAGLGATTAALVAGLALGLAALAWAAPRPAAVAAPVNDQGTEGAEPDAKPFANRSFRRLLMVFLVNGIASAVPATLVLFFIRDRLQAPAYEALFLGSYFGAGVLSLPLWLAAVKRFGLARCWLAGMLLAVAAFAWAAALGSGDVAGFWWVCVASGMALGADLSLPGALLAGVIQRAGHGGRFEGRYFGWWNFATKLNLALAAGVALPLLGLLGYQPGSQAEAALQALTLVYCALPCALKIAAAALLYGSWIRTREGT